MLLSDGMLDEELRLEMLRYRGLTHTTLMAVLSEKLKNMRDHVGSYSDKDIRTLLAIVKTVVKDHEGKISLDDVDTANFLASLFGAKVEYHKKSEKMVDIWEE